MDPTHNGSKFIKPLEAHNSGILTLECPSARYRAPEHHLSTYFGFHFQRIISGPGTCAHAVKLHRTLGVYADVHGKIIWTTGNGIERELLLII